MIAQGGKEHFKILAFKLMLSGEKLHYHQHNTDISRNSLQMFCTPMGLLEGKEETQRTQLL